MTTWIICIAAAYVVGSIPVGVLLGRARGVDIREHGSRNIGATNVMRVLGRRMGILCFVLDAAKGAVPVLAAGAATGVLGRPAVAATPVAGALAPREQALWLLVAIAAVIGHMFSLFLGLRGGKGVATGFGGLAAMWPILTIPCAIGLVVWAAALRLTRYVSVASMSAAMSLPLGYFVVALARGAPLAAIIRSGWPPLVLTAILAGLVIYRHRRNITRIRRGDEPRVGDG